MQNYSRPFVFTTDSSSLFIYLHPKTVHLSLYILSCFAYPSHCPLIISFSLSLRLRQLIPLRSRKLTSSSHSRHFLVPFSCKVLDSCFFLFSSKLDLMCFWVLFTVIFDYGFMNMIFFMLNEMYFDTFFDTISMSFDVFSMYIWDFNFFIINSMHFNSYFDDISIFFYGFRWIFDAL